MYVCCIPINVYQYRGSNKHPSIWSINNETKYSLESKGKFQSSIQSETNVMQHR